ncbi:uncharacterized protein LOC132886624 isoform X2 [Neoarius graeffei]|uniref:uncharacterized protein LOC132886624 isoform X2 n=1 Tax=Neoarius graeffei TaxID=443677 RepID=UPI00298D585D|nr:uncharacterized protein LOC132886624 isoform X2 [Neoarius graeffei]XP_060777497.1 uncharacterized protein LOC132886624 isoform X2 [Neoarius graeffei]XP_060777498.1 uncharacterized protein LOC132886624 isoform X2 [Neoarius graeffei]XP_060777499.1 uncharacterized protein LOC132886624 isoform X2 [Neoarius graeffei]XP_060777500.1 uncharacterized protein LOC132886624 isoform X2 [Neoarius graeffei]XP_060777501.1 uncharacterized protein LOC132886624 isoform X2 [Neoarius graeffei]XP_060777503.1 un
MIHIHRQEHSHNVKHISSSTCMQQQDYTEMPDTPVQIDTPEVALSLLKYTTTPFSKLPCMPLTVCGHVLAFLVDSGAGHSVIQHGVLPVDPPLSSNSIQTMGISGRPVTETFSVNLPCKSEGGIVTSHSFLISHTCPVNLLARDLMCKLEVNLTSTPDGLTIEVSEMCGVQYGFGSPLYVYVWQLCSDQFTQTPKHLVQLAHLNTSSVDTDYMKEEDLHCTAHVHQGQDVEFEKTWFADPHARERLTLKLCIGLNIIALCRSILLIVQTAASMLIAVFSNMLYAALCQRTLRSAAANMIS